MVNYVVNSPVDEQRLTDLFKAVWPSFKSADVGRLLEASLVHVEAYDDEALVGFVRVLPCGQSRGFVVGPSVHPDAQGKGVGLGLLDEAATQAKDKGVKALHVEFASNQRGFYARAGYRHTAAGVRKL
jgi:GNAT superfamily N-acetyltransferase